MITAFTGPSELTPYQKFWCARQIAIHAQPGIWRSGCAYGLDSIAAYMAIAFDAELELYVPFARHNGTLVNDLSRHSHIIRCDNATTQARAYRIRNNDMIKGRRSANGDPANRLMAFVHSEEFYRSGEWMTINIARAANSRNKSFRLIIREIPNRSHH